MYSHFNSFSTFMGLSDSPPVFLPQKDLQFAMEKECNFFFRGPTLDFQDASQIAPTDEEEERVSEHDQRREAQQGQEQNDQHEKQDRSHDEVLLEVSSSLKVKLPASVREEGMVDEEEEEEEEEEDGCKTPTSMDQNIPVLVCPPPPRKPKLRPSTNKKGSSRRRVLLDLSNEIESLFPPSLLADFGKKIKKVRRESLII